MEKKIFSSLPEKADASSESLPEHVIQRIKKYFSSPDLNIHTLCETCSSLSDHPLLWLKLGFRGKVTPAHTICRILQNSPLLESLRLVDVPDIASILQQLCRCCKHLKHLRVRFCHNGDNIRSVAVPEASLRNIIYSCPNLISLDLKGTNFSGRKFYQELAHLRWLRALKLGCNSLLCSQDIFTIATVCRRRLTHLSIVHSVRGMAPPPKVLCGKKASKTNRHFNQDHLDPLKKISRESYRYHSQVLNSQEFSFLIKTLGTGLVSLELEVTLVEANFFHLICDLCINLQSLHLFNAMNLLGDVVQRIPTTMPHLTHLAITRAYLPSEEDLLKLLFSDRRDKLTTKESMICSSVSTIDSFDGTNWWEGGFPSDDSDSQSEESYGDEMIWKEVSDNSLPLLTSLELSMCSAVSDVFLEVLSEGYVAYALKVLRIRGCQRVTSKGLDLLSNCVNLRYLDASYVDFKRGPSAEWLKRVPMRMPNLNTLVVGFWKEDMSVREAMEELRKQESNLKIRKCLSFFSSKEENISIKEER